MMFRLLCDKSISIHLEFSNVSSVAVIKAIKDDMVTLDMNHPLADQTLHFDVEVMEVRDATDEEIAHRHVHGDGGHHH